LLTVVVVHGDGDVAVVDSDGAVAVFVVYGDGDGDGAVGMLVVFVCISFSSDSVSGPAAPDGVPSADIYAGECQGTGPDSEAFRCQVGGR